MKSGILYDLRKDADDEEWEEGKEDRRSHKISEEFLQDCETLRNTTLKRIKQ